MTNPEFALASDQRNEIMRAVMAIERQVKKMATESQWRVVYVIGTNVTIIRTVLSDMPRITPN